ncbi:putative hydrolase of the HAD superfamily [Chromohalobacter marismortui]|uniref:Putative hydrolase of the HAD superfamily n=1 Tax=Chromohalobacter marismortui TaxID=42055 RepID=A0A4V6Q407_9GAMM|nr:MULTISPECIES: HAD family hydrolase [Chromohalobacter]MCI0510036.1 HAD family hydrolase [Chromohalobacter sp.]MCI0593805.1 HAD family hydrolase [Chromohalobacter sp.]TDU18996.1 putative hydrolase of the HAD superfamily [Chromohalobacter marismortui]
MAITALTFDLDDTLWDNRPVLERAEAGHYQWLSDALADSSPEVGHAFITHYPLHAYQQHRLDVARRFPLKRGDFTWVRERALFEMVEAYGLPRLRARLWAAHAIAHFLDLRHDLTPYPGVVAMLDTLRQRYRIAAITNGNADLKRLDLAEHFSAMIAAGELHAPKPDPRAFLAALARLGAQPSQGLHVGDSWREDVLPAQRLGMQVAWIDAKNEAPHDLPPGVHRLTHVRELPALLTRLTS